MQLLIAQFCLPSTSRIRACRTFSISSHLFEMNCFVIINLWLKPELQPSPGFLRKFFDESFRTIFTAKRIKNASLDVPGVHLQNFSSTGRAFNGSLASHPDSIFYSQANLFESFFFKVCHCHFFGLVRAKI